MGKNLSSFATLMTVFMTAVSIAVPVATPVAFADMAIGKGDAAATLPDVTTMCQRIKDAKAGNLVDANGKPLTFTLQKCAGSNRRTRAEPGCQGSLADLAKADGSVNADTVCTNPSELNQSAQAFCTMRTLANTTQAGQYCEAYDSAKSAEKGVTLTATLDVAAAGVCWAEALSMKALRTQFRNAVGEKEKCEKDRAAGVKGDVCEIKFNLTSSMGPGSIFNKGICGGAAMAAGAGELLQTSKILFGGGHSSGDFKINSDNNVEKRGNLAKVVEIVLSSGLSLNAIQLGICYYSPSAGICKSGNDTDMKGVSLSSARFNDAIKQRNDAQNTVDQEGANREVSQARLAAADAKLAAIKADAPNSVNPEYDNPDCAKYSPCGFNAPTSDEIHAAEREDKEARALFDGSPAKLAQAQQVLTTSGVNARKIAVAFAARANLAHQAALLFTGLAAMRAVSLLSASSTKGKATTILQSMFTPGSAGTTFGTSGLGATGAGMYAATSGSTFSPAPSAGGVASAITAGTPEGFLMPPGAPLHGPAVQIASQIPSSKVQEAAAGGAAGMGGLASSVAESLGAKDTSLIRSAFSTAFANLPKDDGTGYAAGGGSKLAKADTGSGMDLNLKGLFGGGDKEEKGGAEADLAYRGLASDDIWHSHNPKGNNLFQIISDRYDTAQRKQSLSP